MQNLFRLFALLSSLSIFTFSNLIAQDECSNAVNLNVEMYSTCGLMALESIDLGTATPSSTTPTPTCGSFSGTTNDLWYSFQVPSGVNTMAFHAFNSDIAPLFSGTSEPAMAIYRGADCSSLTQLACFESNGGFMQNGEIRWEQVNGLNPGETIYMRVWDQANVAQNLFIAASVRLDMEEDDCDTPIDLSTGGYNILSTGGGLADFNVDLGTGNTQYNGSFTTDIPSGTAYTITVTDLNGCDIFAYNGLTDRGCATNAGTMTSLEPITLCADECTDMIAHNGDEFLEAGDDLLEFVVHEGGNPAIVLARGDTPEFCFSNLSSGIYGTTYYISAIAGDDLGGYVNQNDPCYSQAPGTPVVWFENPIAFISANELTTCGLEISLNATEPALGMTGTWSSTGIFFPVGGTNINSPEVNILANDYGDQTFSWNVTNGICSGSDQVIVHFLETPTAYAGDDFTICGNTTDLEAAPSIGGSTGQWSGNGSFTAQSNPITEVTGGSYGPLVFTWRENVGICWTEDDITVTFIQEPNPTVTNIYDTVCGNTANIEVFNVVGDGTWAAYHEGALLSPAPIYTDSYSAMETDVTIGNYLESNLSYTVEFIWTEINQENSTECTNTATTFVTFSREPSASTGASNAAEECGNCFTLAADTTGSGWAFGTWISPQVMASFDNETIPNTEVCIDPLSSFGDSAYVSVPFIWTMRNTGCTSLDTMWLTFYKQPIANAGLDGSICGSDYELGAVFNLTDTDSYTPFGTWDVYETPPDGGTADIAPQDGDTVNVHVSQFGTWTFTFRENNSNLSSCYDVDTVEVEFIEVPIISAGEDKDICGTATVLEGITAGFNGTWIPNGVLFGDYTDPTTNVNTSSYGTIQFVWLESNQECSSKDTVEITFWRQPEATILTDAADSTICGYTFCNLRAEAPGSGINGYWFSYNSATTFDDPFSNFTCATVPNYGYHNFYWIEQTGPELEPGFCNDTAGPLTIHFIETPIANAGIDTLFCGYSGYLEAMPSSGTGTWSSPSSSLIVIENINDPNSYIESEILNTGNETNPYFNLIWTEDGSNECTDSDTMRVVFARVPTSEITIIPPKCFGEPATISAVEDSLQQYTWDFYNGVIDSIVPANPIGGYYQHFVYWNTEDTLHQVSLIAMNSWNCQSIINIDTVYEPTIPIYDYELFSDTCMLGKGGIMFIDTLDNNAFFWLDTTYGPTPGTPITTIYDLPTGTYDIASSYLTLNYIHYAYYISTFGTANCVDTLEYEIETIGMIEAEIEISANVILNDLVAPEATVAFLNNSDYDDVSKRCEWHFGDDVIEKNCDSQVEHIYTEAGCYEPFLIVMNRDLPECRDTAILDACIKIDNASKLEVPNVFSPNGDGTNDFFQVKAQTLNTFSGTIINRWGRAVFTWENWQDYEAGWDGKLSGGTKASAGVYYYNIKAVGMDEVKYNLQGALHLFSE